ncbi:tRNA (adenosine(37)-N6)-threonylcarbamoyltransferase complex dimerization subunit type 1 TsaB [Desulfitibacter alkalitolerans]|uniref:tRNA (adenosine(37)-N6)-threonylcarbamoyltransferase complex dimerization subunit type 1 TsaB n=1 Tax=Desulfitibacter alkalitolerans TaxID=264641 RepID=UPI0004843339|nr:tRNA (adenosine(37)-N6)-threonylcarbamoyltransferase complex dimerization subunit type 1 TsaB [Desulfitibacter alkalitolerans]
MIVLGIDSSTQVNTIALLQDGQLLCEAILNTRKNHSQRLMPMIDILLKEAGLTIENVDGVAVSSGPGSFTGLRIGMTTGKALAWSRNKPLVGIPSLDGVAFNAQGVTGTICPILNAKRNEVYTALYKMVKGELQRISDYMAVEPLELIKRLQNQSQVTLLGDGIEEFISIFAENLGDRLAVPSSANRLPRASHIAYLGWRRLLKGEADDVINLVPLYVRKADAEIKLESKGRST